MLKLLTLTGMLLTAGSSVAATTIQVSPQGDDTANGVTAPVASLERARELARQAAGQGQAVVELAAGVYPRSGLLAFGAADSGQPGAPTIYRAAKGAAVRVVGGQVVRGWRPVTDPALLARLEPAARGQVLVADLRAQGLSDYGAVNGGLEVFCRDVPQTLARWPNTAFVKVVEPTGATELDVRGTKGRKEGQFRYDGDRPARWTAEAEPWVHGYWFWDWSDGRQRVSSIDLAKQELTLAPPHHGYGYRKGQWYYAYNLFSEIDGPGEWYLDRAAGLLYLWPPHELAPGDVVVSVVPTLFTVDGARDLWLQGLTCLATRSTAISIRNSERVEVVGCTILNTGAGGVGIDGGQGCVVRDCDILQVGSGGISVSGGNRQTLRRGDHAVLNNNIHDYGRINRMYSAGVTVGGVGQRVANNLIHNAPHMAIQFGGNDHLLELNEIHSVCYESNDAGAVYAGRDWTHRGNVIRHNYLHDITGFEGRGCVGVYLDDMFSSAANEGNVYCRVTMAAFIGGGRDNTVLNNLFVDCKPALHIDCRALNWASYHVATTMKERLDAMPFRAEPWSTRYPQLLTLWDDEPAAPKGNRVARNLCSGGTWEHVEARARAYLTIEQNLVAADIGLLHRDRLAPERNPRPTDFALDPNGPASQIGFQPLPLDQMGLRPSPLRASWPVVHAVRPAQTPPPGKGRPPAPTAAVRRATGTVTVDALRAGPWAAVEGQPLAVVQSPSGELQAPPCRAWLLYDAARLYVFFETALPAGLPPTRGQTWGQDDAVEVALAEPGQGKPILIWRGYANGHWETSDEAGTAAELVQRAAQGVQYAAATEAAGWRAELAIPWAATGLDPAKVGRIACSLAVRRLAGNQWLLWRGTGSHTWRVDEAGTLTLAR
ncbi:MAG: right-handed parallel beta-helix repeat-containing protein [Fimbriimonadaceae bacterium]|nr:right-handed parallel beta-helix repeat-containing protein [Fimbriimonadaceae bacterium]